MQASSKAVLLSALICPGAGQLFLRRYVSGGALLAAALAAIYVLVSHTLAVVRTILVKVQNAEVQMDVTGLTDMIATANTSATKWATIVLAIVWLISVVDAWFAGRRLDQQQPDRDIRDS